MYISDNTCNLGKNGKLHIFFCLQILVLKVSAINTKQHDNMDVLPILYMVWHALNYCPDLFRLTPTLDNCSWQTRPLFLLGSSLCVIPSVDEVQNVFLGLQYWEHTDQSIPLISSSLKVIYNSSSVYTCIICLNMKLPPWALANGCKFCLKTASPYHRVVKLFPLPFTWLCPICQSKHTNTHGPMSPSHISHILKRYSCYSVG